MASFCHPPFLARMIIYTYVSLLYNKTPLSLFTFIVSHDVVASGRVTQSPRDGNQPQQQGQPSSHPSNVAARQHNSPRRYQQHPVFSQNPHPSNVQPSVQNIQRIYRGIENAPVVWSQNLENSTKPNGNDLCLQDVSSEGTC